MARVYGDHVGKSELFWGWFAWWYAVPNSGHTKSRREAFLEVERRYNQHLGGNR